MRGRPLSSGFWAGVFVALIVAALAAAGHDLWRRLAFEEVHGHAVVIDGDSLRLDGRELRLMGIDAPEYRQTCLRGLVEEPCGKRAREALVRLLADGVLACTVEGRDRYGRGLAVCRVGGEDVNAAMVRQGQAISYGRYQAEEDAARRDRAGIWATRFQRPAEWRAAHPRPDHGS